MSAKASDVVARIAYLTSDILIHSQEPRTTSDSFPTTFTSSSCHPSEIQTLQSNADPAPRILRAPPTASLITLTLTSPDALSRLLPHFASFSTVPLVIHALVHDDISHVLALRNAIPFILYSSNPQLAHDNSLLAARLARTERKPVLHFFHNTFQQNVEEASEDNILPFLTAPQHVSHANGNGTNHTNGHSAITETSPETEELFKSYESASLSTLAVVRHAVRPFTYTGPANASVLLISLGALPSFPPNLPHTALLAISLFRPLPPSKLIHAIPGNVKKIIVLEQVHSGGSKWSPLYLDIISAYHVRDQEGRPEIIPALLGNISSSDDFSHILHRFLSLPNPTVLGHPIPATHRSKSSIEPPHVPAHEKSYTDLLHHLFGANSRLEIVNSPSLVPTHGEAATRPEFALGRVQAQLELRDELVEVVKRLLSEGSGITKELHGLIAKWLIHKDDAAQAASLSSEIIPLLNQANATPTISRALSLSSHFSSPSRWIIGSDAWSYDLGSSGLHHLITSSNLNINILLLDTTPYTTRHTRTSKKDAGLYAMNHGDVYVASIAVYSSYSQALQALQEADKFNGPSVVLAYLPYESESTPALEVLKETKLAVDNGYWPLYRWNPSNSSEPFSLDSDAIKQELKEFLDRQNHLSQLSAATPALASELVGSLGSEIKEARQRRAKEAFDKLVSGMGEGGPSVVVLYSSDGGNAEKLAKRLGGRAKVRGVNVVKVEAFDSAGGLTEIAKLGAEGEATTVLFITSTAGQGEPPQNGRDTFKTVNAAFARSDKPFQDGDKKLKFGVFGLGDSHYWPRPEDKGYYNKPGKDLDLRLEQLGGERVIALGLGDDQDADGFQTGYKAWEPLLWKHLGVDAVEVKEAEPEPITNEHIKIASNYLRGTIKEGLADTSTGALAPSDGQLTKFHGIYEQDDRDIRDERKAQGLEPAYAFMIRVRMPGGVCEPNQWLAMDRIADERGNGTFKLTTRQTFQFHGVIKKHLKPSIQAINKCLLDTLAACGDVNRNVLAASLPTLSHLHAQVHEAAKACSEHLKPRTTAYHEVWLDQKLVAGDAVQDFEPLYGPYYLPRKFKVAIAVPPVNDVDVFANDVGFIAIADSNGELVGFNVTAGGGMGVTHSNKKTYPRTGDILGFCKPNQLNEVAEKIMLTQRDNGNRADRKNARLKYTMDRMGVDNFKAEVEKRLGYKLQPARSFNFDSNIDTFGWTKGYDGKHHFTAFIENGRIKDEHEKPFKTGLREIAKIHKGKFRLTANQHLIISDVDEVDVPVVKNLLAKYNLDNVSQSALRLSSSACVAFPTCGLAMAESERYLPLLIDKLEKICEENGLRDDSIVMRMTGCPNGCARPYIAEVAFVGKAPGTYLLLLGGGYYGQRLNKIYRESVTEPEIIEILTPMIKRYALERQEGEHFGDFVIRAGYISATKSGKEWYDGAGGEGEWRVETA